MGFVKIPVKGMNDFLPNEMLLREYVIKEIKDTYTKFGFHIIETPCLEHIENLCSKQGGENEKLIFKVLKRGDKLDYSNAKDENDLVDMIIICMISSFSNQFNPHCLFKIHIAYKIITIC